MGLGKKLSPVFDTSPFSLLCPLFQYLFFIFWANDGGNLFLFHSLISIRFFKCADAFQSFLTSILLSTPSKKLSKVDLYKYVGITLYNNWIQSTSWKSLTLIFWTAGFYNHVIFRCFLFLLLHYPRVLGIFWKQHISMHCDAQCLYHCHFSP